MTEENKTGVVPIDQVNSILAPNYISAYSNNVQFAVGVMDISLIFGEIQNVDAAGKITVEQRARITMNPVQVVILRAVLDRTLKIFERRLGRPIEMPPELRGIIEATEKIDEG